MAGDKHLYRDPSSGKVTERAAKQTSSGAADAGRTVGLNSQGLIDDSMLPPDVGGNADELTAGESLSAGDKVYVNASEEVMKANGGASGVAAQGFVLTSATSGNPVTVYWEGRNTALSTLTPGARYYLGDTAGAVTDTPITGSGKIHQYVGRAINSTTLVFEPDDAITLA